MLHGAVDTLTTIEIQREQRAFSDGRERYLNRLEKNNRPSTQNNPHTLITKALPLVSAAIKSLIETEGERSSGRRPKWFKDLVGLDPDILAYIGLNACMDTVVISGQSTCVLTKIGHRIRSCIKTCLTTLLKNTLVARLERKLPRQLRLNHSTLNLSGSKTEELKLQDLYVIAYYSSQVYLRNGFSTMLRGL